MSNRVEFSIAVNRFGLGARPGELERIGQPREWLRGQLAGGAPLLDDPALPSARDILTGAAALLEERSAPPESAATTAGDAAAARQGARQQQANRLPRYYRPIYVTDVRARVLSAVGTGRPFVERLVQFWSNHFAVSVDKVAVLGLAGALEREAIRPHVLGRFSELLLAVEKHPAMQLFLDNQSSIGPNSAYAKRAGQRSRAMGLNENLAREVLELHTLGVDGGYTQADVTSLARVLTGWSINGVRGALRRLDTGPPGEFVFRPLVHEPGAQAVLGRRYAQEGVAQGEAVLRDLAAAPATARHLATKLARHFVADEPPAALVQRLSDVFTRSGGDLAAVYRALIDAPEPWATTTPKFKTPNDYVLSIYRGLDLPVPAGQQALSAFELLGQRQFSPGSPAGWPDRSVDWDGSAALLKRIEFADAVAQRVGNARDASALASQLLGAVLSDDTRQSIARAANGVQALTLLLTAPEFMRR